MRLQIKQIILLIGMFYLLTQGIFSQHISRDNYTGAWETSASWNQAWTSPQTIISGFDITINGYITVNGSLAFSGSPTNLIINDTLIIMGDLLLDNFNNLTVNDSGIIIVRGNFAFNNNAKITANGYLIISGNIDKGGPYSKGSFTSNDNPVKVYVGGTVAPLRLSENQPNFPAFNCTAPITNPYPHSNCSNGDMTDLINDPIYPFFQSTCTTVTPTITSGGPPTFCDGGGVTLTSSTGTSYLWSTGATTSSINATSSGSYTVQVTNTGGCQSAASVATIVTVNTLPAPIISADGPATFCAGGSVTLTSSEGTSYLWSNAVTTPDINVNTSGSFSVQVTDANGCQSAASALTVVNVNPLPEVNAGKDTTIANGTSTTIDATVTGTGPFTYNWSPSGQLVNALIEDPTTVNLPATTFYTLMAKSETTSCSNTDEVTITISGGALSSIPTATPGIVCTGESIQLHAIASGGSGSYNYTWTSTPGGFTSSIADPIANPMINTTYKVAVNDGFTTVNSPVVVTVNALPVTPTINASGPLAFCVGGSVTLTSSAGTKYIWSNGETTQSINVTTSGSYTVQVTNSNDCQSAPSAAKEVTVNTLPVTPTITPGGPTAFCAGSSMTLTSSAGTSYLWSTGATTQNINVTTGGSYTVMVTNAGGCQSEVSVATIVTVNALPATPAIFPVGPTTFCEGGSVTLISSAGSTYLWSTGATAASINVTIAGSYAVRVANVNGCQSAASPLTIINVNALPLVNITSSSSPLCTSDLRVLTASPAGGTFIITGGPGNISGNVLSSTGIGNINLEYNYTNVCTNTAKQSIIVKEKPDAVAGPDKELKFIFETQLAAEFSLSGTGEWSVISGSGQIQDIYSPISWVTGLSVGENIFLWTVRNGSCEASDEVTITVYDLFVPSVVTPNGDGKNDFFQLNALAGSIELIIFNRWGNEEYTNCNYLNDWDGRNNKGVELPNDTYFYVLKFGNVKIKKGSVLIKR